MANYYSLKSFLRETRNSLLQIFFKGEGVLDDFKWVSKAKDGTETPLPETEVDGLVEAIQKLNPDDRIKLEHVLKDITSLADENIISTMIDHGKKPRYGIKLAEEFSENKMKGPFDRVMWVYLEHKALFKYTLKYIQVISTSGTRDFLIEIKKDYKTNQNKLGAFKESVIKHYKGRGRGDKCIIDDYYRNEDIEQYCYYIFHEDCIKSELKFNEKGDDVVRNPQHRIFENVFFFEPKTGNLRIHANGEKNTEKLADLFCKHMLGLDGRPNMDTKIYNMSKILENPDFEFDNEASIKKVHVTEIVCDMGNNEEVILKTKNKARKELLLLERLHMAVTSYGIGQSSAEITKLRFHVEFAKQEGFRKKTRTREIALPNRTDLTDDSYDNIIRRHIEKKWKFKDLLAEKAKVEAA
jgi:hypothetical protein